jgi:DNA-binding transcriptional LysR family regulator
LSGHHVRDTEARFYASRTWVDRHGLPREPAELAGPALLGFDDTERYAAYLRTIGIPMDNDAFRLISENSVVIWEMVRRGLGVAAMLREVADRTPGIVQLLPQSPPIVVPVWLVTHRELYTSRRIRVVHDILREELAGPPAPPPA